ncbi:hypothetical protein PTNB85_01435 [Pyrenophora teres f. teres]|nr:hypothetical protein PTNB85_01435 [Pyrenophora teres f. teres]
MLFSWTILTVTLAVMPSVQAAPKKNSMPAKNWIELDCWVADVTVDGRLVDSNPELKYDWQLTVQTCQSNYKGLANYDNGKGRCVSINPDGLSGPQWWANCVKQAANGWYDVDRSTGNIVIKHNGYKSSKAEGRGYAYSG